MNHVRASLAAVLVLALAGCSSGSGEPAATKTVTETVTAQASTAPETEEATIADDEPVTLRPRDFTIKVKIKRKSCFGSAGCNVDYQIVPAYNGLEDVTTGSYEVTYQVMGGEDGPQVNTFTLEDGQASYPDSETISTPSSSTVLKAKVTSVDTQ